MPNAYDPRLHFGGQPDRPDRPDEPPASDDATFRLGGLEPEVSDPARATVLDPGSWPSEPPYAAAPPAPQPEPAPEPAIAPVPLPVATLRRFGPGVPGPDTSAGTAQTAAVWHGTVRPGEPVVPPGGGSRPRRALRGWLLTAVVLLGVLAYLLWQRFPSPVQVDSVAVRNDTAVQGCHSTARVVGTLRTSGGAGTVRYRWHRSDGTVSDELKQHVAKGDRSTDVVLLWTFDGPGSLTATATLDVLGPQQRSASTTFSYTC